MDRRIEQNRKYDSMSDDHEKEEMKRQTLIKRIIVAIVLLIKENPILPFQFQFMGTCLLESLKEERQEYKNQRGLGAQSMSRYQSLYQETPNKGGYYDRAMNSSFMQPAVTPPSNQLQYPSKYRQGCETYI